MQAQYLHKLVGPTANETMQKAKAKKKSKISTISLINPKPKTFEWMTKHWDAFDALKEALRITPVLGYPDFPKGFTLETDASLKGLGAIWSQQGKDGMSM